MDATQRKKFVCKFCNKRYPCGKSLGGHIRIHLNGNGNHNSSGLDQEAKFNTSNNGVVHSKRELESEVEANSQSAAGYGLRENPKKTKRFVLDSNKSKLLPEKVCKECGKGFQSLKALCGHMACHSKNNNTSSFDDYSGTSEKLKEGVTDGQSDTETSTPSKGRRSKRLMRYNTVGVYSSSLSLQNGSLSSASDVEQEQEEVAMSLMMLSRDSGFKGCFSFVADSSDNNSVVVEAKSYSTKMRISVKNGGNFVFNGKELLEMKKSKQRELVAIVNDDHSDDDNSDSGYFRNEPKKVKSEISVHGFTGNHHLFKKHNAEFGLKLEDEDEDFDAELGKRLSSFRRVKAQHGRDSVEEDAYDPADGASMKCYYSRKKIKDEVCSSEFRSSSAQKRFKYLSLDGHRSSHRRTNRCSDPVYESGENSIDNDVYTHDPVPSRTKLQSSGNNAERKSGSKKRKVHECPFCAKVFQSGQALGGHKRSHFVGVGEDRTLVINQEVPEIPMPALIDLNLPAPADEDAAGYMPW